MKVQSMKDDLYSKYLCRKSHLFHIFGNQFKWKRLSDQKLVLKRIWVSLDPWLVNKSKTHSGIDYDSAAKITSYYKDQLRDFVLNYKEI